MEHFAWPLRSMPQQSAAWAPALMGLLRLVLGRAMTESLSSPVVARDIIAARQNRPFTISTLAILSLTFASLSIVSTLCTLYWFVKMRKGFRHELIMLLIQSDFIKSVAFLVFPIVSFLRGFVESDSKFCQASGFILAMGIEASDIAVLLIALHSLMYILRPRSGLYPYRRFAYLIYYVFPTLIASMAFINGKGYENVGHYCYLDRSAGWRRMALSWIPRYIISTTIIVIYAFIYFYIRGRMIDYGRRSSGFVEDAALRTPMPAVPSLSYHGLLSSAATSRRGSAADSVVTKTRQRSISSASSVGLTHDGFATHTHAVASHSRRTVEWAWTGFPQQATSEKVGGADDPPDPLAPVLENISEPSPTHAPRDAHHPDIEPLERSLAPQPQHTSHTNRTTRPSPVESVAQPTPAPPTLTGSFRQKFRTRPNPLSSTFRPKPPLSLAPTADTDPIVLSSAFLEPGLEQNRDKVRRQLRSLFMYPLVYIIVWVFPFVSHVMGYDDSVRPGDPEWLLILGIISLCGQGTVDCALFTFRERPWRQARGGFWESLWKRLRLFDSDVSSWGLSGRTQEEMLVDGKLARQRRDEEEVWERMRRESPVQAGVKGVDRGPVREWWDVDFDDEVSRGAFEVGDVH
ncbi:G protein-coupled glucose receptor regulating Gpa2-domain-containing protein [Podospora conica]|nr:G protein-coupled glucose receptor regulating Gpa2-domain-containing protein [Schizothecium conicum]